MRLCFLIFLLVSAIINTGIADLTIQTQYGTLEGIKEDKTISFKAVPYADEETPRFSHPLPPKKWQGVRNAKIKGPSFPQPEGRLANIRGIEKSNYSEGAFHLTIWRPDTTKKNLPVVIYVHGGGFIASGGNENFYNGSLLSQENEVIIVNVNYRLGALGNLYLPEQNINGNYALKDLVAASKWIKENIADFGGDNENITLVGQSVGAWFVGVLIGMEEAKGIFERAIILSAIPSLKPSTKEEAITIGKDLLKHLKTNVQTASVEEILKAQAILMHEEATQTMITIPITFRTVDIDGSLKDIFTEKWAKQTHAKEVIISTVATEMTAFLQPIAHSTRLPDPKKYAEHFSKSTKDYIIIQDTDKTLNHCARKRANHSNYNMIVDVSTDHFFKVPALQYADLLSKNGKIVYVYQFDYSSLDKYLQTPHVMDIPFFFGNFKYYPNAPMLKKLDPEEMEGLSKKYRHTMMNFVKTGNPNCLEARHAEFTLNALPYTEKNNYQIIVFDSIIKKEVSRPEFSLAE